MTTRLTPSFWRSTSSILGACVVMVIIETIRLGKGWNHWWDADYIPGLAIFFVIASVLSWLLAIPKELEFSDTHFTIQYRFRCGVTVPWSDLKYWGKWATSFMTQFVGRGTFQVFASAYPKSERSKLINFLSANFSERKATGYIGPRMFRWRKR